MAKSYTQNQKLIRIFQLLRTRGAMTRQDIASTLHQSMPTVLQSISELLALEILEEGRTVNSSGGRRAKEVRLNRMAGFALGMEILPRHVTFMLTDLLGNPLHTQSVPAVFTDETLWYQELSNTLEQFLSACGVDSKHVCGAGLSFPGVIDTKTDQVLRSHVFQLENMKLERFRRYIPFPLVFDNDANCACMAEYNQLRKDFLYVSLNAPVGGAIMRDGQLLSGNTFQAGEIGHMILVPNGKRCYCGKYGCVDAYLSPEVLVGDAQYLDDFFRDLRSGSDASQKIWDNYLDDLAILLTNLQMLENTEIVVGGVVSGYLLPYIDQLREKARKYDSFARDVDYISVSQTALPCAMGAAVSALNQYSSAYISSSKFKQETPAS